MNTCLILTTIVGAIFAGMGVGGGSIYIILSTNFNNIAQKEAQILNLILFISVSVSVVAFNLKNKKIKFDLLKKIIPCLIIGSFFGTKLVKVISNEKLKIYFTVFLLIVGLYEIISSLFFNKNTKNNNEQ